MKKLILATLLLAFAPAVLGAQARILFNGGVTLEERDQAPDQGTRLVFFVTSGNFLSDIAVSITNEAGAEVVNTTTEGPWLVLDLDPGSYQVVAEGGDGQVQSLVIEVGDSGQEFGFSFPEEI